MLIVKYSDPPLTEAEEKALEEKKQKNEKYTEQVTMQDITHYICSECTWSGDDEQAARKFEFNIAYTTAEKDSTFINIDIKLGGFIYVYWKEEGDPIEIFEGRIFYKKRNSNSYQFSFTAYDDAIYLAKSRIQKYFDNVTVTNAIKQICSEIGIPVSENIPNIETVVTMIADRKTCTETFRMLFEKAKADSTKLYAHQQRNNYTVVCINGEITIVKQGETISDFTITDTINLIDAEHSESIENMINRVKAVDEVGNICQVFTVEDDVIHYGMFQDIYKMEKPKQGESVDNIKAAKARLKTVNDESSLKALGSIQCITGYCVMVQEEQLKGKFFIKSDTHKFNDDRHTMDLTLVYQPEEPTEIIVKQEDLAGPVFKSSKERKKK